MEELELKLGKLYQFSGSGGGLLTITLETEGGTVVTVRLPPNVEMDMKVGSDLRRVTFDRPDHEPRLKVVAVPTF